MGNRKHPLRCTDNQNVAPFMVKRSREDVALRRAARAIVERLAYVPISRAATRADLIGRGFVGSRTGVHGRRTTRASQPGEPLGIMGPDP
jgi:hypothetical protein